MRKPENTWATIAFRKVKEKIKMCMNLGYVYDNPEQTDKDVEKYKTRTACAKNKKGTITVYKVLRFCNGKLYSYSQNSPWVKGEVKISSRKKLKNPAELTYGEKKFLGVAKGLHFFTNLKEARSWGKSRANSWQNTVIQIWKVEVNTKDIVSYGSLGTYSCLVAHKAKLIKKVG